jgi:short chain dehydrogenase
MPADNALGPHQDKMPAPITTESADHDPDELVAGAEPRSPPSRAGQDRELMAEQEILDDQCLAVADGCTGETEEQEHVLAHCRTSCAHGVQSSRPNFAPLHRRFSSLSLGISPSVCRSSRARSGRHGRRQCVRATTVYTSGPLWLSPPGTRIARVGPGVPRLPAAGCRPPPARRADARVRPQRYDPRGSHQERCAMREFDGRVAVATGAASGIGRAFAERFARAGMKVVLADLEAGALDTAVHALRRQEFDVMGVQVDVARPEAVEELAQA